MNIIKMSIGFSLAIKMISERKQIGDKEKEVMFLYLDAKEFIKKLEEHRQKVSKSKDLFIKATGITEQYETCKYVGEHEKLRDDYIKNVVEYTDYATTPVSDKFNLVEKYLSGNNCTEYLEIKEELIKIESNLIN